MPTHLRRTSHAVLSFVVAMLCSGSSNFAAAVQAFPDPLSSTSSSAGDSNLAGVILVAILAGASITLVSSLTIITLYKRHVRLAMKLESRKPVNSPHQRPAPSKDADPDSPWLLLYAKGRLKRLATVYAVAGCGCAAVLTLALLLEAGHESFTGPLVFFTIFAWPVILCWNGMAGENSPARRRNYWAYAAVLAALGLVNFLLKPSGNPLQIPQAFVLANAIPTILIACFASPAVRTIGPFILSLSTLGALGTWYTVHFVTKNRSALLLLDKWATAMGASPISEVFLLGLCSVVIFFALGFGLMTLIIRNYSLNKASDQSIQMDSIWLIVALSQDIFICTSSNTATGRGVVVALFAFPAYWFLRTVGLWWFRKSEVAPPPRVSLLYLRRFALRGRTEHLFRVITLFWRLIGDVRLIGGPDLARSTIQPHSLLQFLLRRTNRNLISSNKALEQQLTRLPAPLDVDTRSRITDFLCANDQWENAVTKLMEQTHTIFADFRGFVPDSKGALYEIEQMLLLVPAKRVLILTDRLECKAYIDEAISAFLTKLGLDSQECQARRERLKVMLRADSEQQTASVLKMLFSLADEHGNHKAAAGSAY